MPIRASRPWTGATPEGRGARGVASEFPPIDTTLPAFRYDVTRCELYGKNGRSCSPSVTYVISCRDLRLMCSAGLAACRWRQSRMWTPPGRQA